MKKLYILIFLIVFANALYIKAENITRYATTFMLSNEAPGYLVDNLIAEGWGDSSLYSVTLYLASTAPGVIPQAFLDTLKDCPPGSEIFTTALHYFSSEYNNPIGINSDGTTIVSQIYGFDFLGLTDKYITTSGKQRKMKLDLFTSAKTKESYIEAGTLTITKDGDKITTFYQAFAIAWASPVSLSFVISNEEPGCLIDNLISVGYGDSSLYSVLQHLAPKSGGTIPQSFLDSLKKRPAGSDVFNFPLKNFTGSNHNPIYIKDDGGILIAPLYGKDYFNKQGYTTIKCNSLETVDELITAATSPDYYINVGSKYSQQADKKSIVYYRAFAIAWAKPQENDTTTALTFMLSNEAPGYLIDNLIANGYGDSSLYSVMVSLQPVSEGVIRQSFLDTLRACPAGSQIFAAPLSAFRFETNNPVGINSDGSFVIAPLYGRDYFQKKDYTTYYDNTEPVALKLFTASDSEDGYVEAAFRTNNGITTYYMAFAIAWSRGSTVVLSNEAPGYMIDTLIAKGYGNKNLYEVISTLQPVSGGAIPENYVKQLAALPQSSDLFNTTLNNYAEFNNPVTINSGGRVGLRPVFGRDYINNTNFTTHRDSLASSHSISFTNTGNPEQYIDAGAIAQGDTIRFQAFAVVWSDAGTDVPEAPDDMISIYPNPFSDGIYISNIEYPTEIEIFDILGRNVFNTNIEVNRFIPLSFLPNGIYWIKFGFGSEKTLQFLIKH